MTEPEILVEPDPKAGPLVAVKGMLLQTSLEELKAIECFDRYAELLGPSKLAELTDYLVGEWVPVEAMRTHYTACEDLRLTPMQLDEVGRRVGERLQNRLLSTLAATSRMAGFSPWIAIPPMYRMAGRVFQGSTARVTKIGPKEGELVIYGNSLFDFQYFRVAYCGTVRGMFGLLGVRNINARIVHQDIARSEVTLRISWS